MMADLVRQAVANLRAHLGRTLLTLVGIAWGTASVMIFSAWGTGLQATFVEQAASAGRHMIAFLPGHSSSGVGTARGGRPIRFRRSDARLLEQQLGAHLDYVSAGTMRWGGVHARFRASSRRVPALGVEVPARDIFELAVGAGRWFDAQDLAQRRRVAVLGAELARQLFGARQPVGERMEVNGIGYTVVGVLRRKGGQAAPFGPADDDKLVLPLTTFQSLITGDDEIDFIAVGLRPGESREAVTALVRRVLGLRHGFSPTDPDAVSTFDVSDTIELFERLTGALRFFALAVSIVTLAIGGVGVMNILLLAVAERSREVGLRKALGATRGLVVAQFLVEALLMAAAGGGVGVAVGWVCCLLAPIGTQPGSYAIQFLSWQTVVMSAALLTAVGLAAGVWPAARAARLDPARSMRLR